MNNYTLSANEKATVLAVFCALDRMPYSELNTFLGTETIVHMTRLHHRLFYDDYCKNHGTTYEEMTTDDFINAWYEMHPDFEEDN